MNGTRVVVGAMGIALFLIGGAAYYSYFRGVTENGGSVVSDAEGRVHIQERGAPSLGRSDAKVTIVEFADFQCPLCAVFHFGAGAALIDQYVKRGDARFVFKQFPLLGDESFRAAYAAECAKEQGAFWNYHNALFARTAQGTGENTGVFSREALVRIAGEVGTRTDSFAQCLDRQTHKETVLQDLEDGRAAGVEGTPTLFINGRKFTGTYPFEEYQKVIEEELQR